MVEVLIIVLLLLVAVSSIRPNKCVYGEFEMRRRTEHLKKRDLLNWRRYQYYQETLTIRRVAVMTLVSIVTILYVATFGVVTGMVLAIATAFFYMRIAIIGPIHRLFQWVYNRFESKILSFSEHASAVIRVLGGTIEPDPERSLSSREELVHLAESSEGVLTKDQKNLIRSGLEFDNKIVKDYMTPRSAMETIGINELLGPLVLDRLHKTTHTHFPVMDGDIDHLVGILHIYSLFTLHNKKSLVVRDAMEPRVFYINENQSLEDALTTCIKHRRHLLVVVNEFRETVGVITIEDVTCQLIGREITDQYDDHDDLRAVAERYGSSK